MTIPCERYLRRSVRGRVEKSRTTLRQLGAPQRHSIVKEASSIVVE